MVKNDGKVSCQANKESSYLACGTLKAADMYQQAKESADLANVEQKTWV